MKPALIAFAVILMLVPLAFCGGGINGPGKAGLAQNVPEAGFDGLKRLL